MSSKLTSHGQKDSSDSFNVELDSTANSENLSEDSPASTSQTTPLESDIDIEQNEDLITEEMKQEEEELAKAAEEEETNALAKVKQEFDANVRDNRLKSLHFLLEQSSAYATILGQRMEKQKEEAREKATKASTKPEKEPAAPEAEKNITASRTTRSGEKVTAAAPVTKSKKAATSDAKKRKAKDGDYNLEDYIDSDDLKRRKVGEKDIDQAIREDQVAAKAADEQRTKPSPSARQPSLVTGGILRDYQLAGVEWLITLWENGLNGILADEMGLGKTLQTIAFIAHLKAMNVSGPFLICTPLSTLANWVQEFHRFTPDINVLLYHGKKEERLHMINRKLQPKKQLQQSFPIVVTSYEIVMNDRKFLQKYNWKYIVVDEGHRIKNLNCRLIHELKSFKSANRLLLTGTPLQNSLAELWSLLNFLLPEIFNDLDTFQSWFDFSDMNKQSGRDRIMKEEEEDKVVSKLHMILRPFLLRRLKIDVEKSLPRKKEYLLFAPLTKPQKELYDAIIRRDLRKYLVAQMSTTGKEDDSEIMDETNGPRRSKRGNQTSSYREIGDRDFFSGKENNQEEKPVDNVALGKRHEMTTVLKQVNGLQLQNMVMQLRKVCNHPFLFDWPIDRATNLPVLNNQLAAQSGKVLLLDRLLTALFERKHKVLVFSQMTRMLDILEDWATELKGWPICRLDGSVSQEERRQQIAHFNDPQSNVRLFLLSTRAGGLGINLTAADTVVIFDSDWNPQIDLQAQDRVHRIGQTKPVLIYRFVTANTVEAKILERATAKRRLEKLVIHSNKFRAPVSTLSSSEKKERDTSMRELAEILASEDGEQVQIVAQGDKVLSDDDLEKLLDRSEKVYSDESSTASGQFRELDTSEMRDGKNEILATRV